MISKVLIHPEIENQIIEPFFFLDEVHNIDVYFHFLVQFYLMSKDQFIETEGKILGDIFL